jgi:hypothetical protein
MCKLGICVNSYLQCWSQLRRLKWTYIYLIFIERFNKKNRGRGLCNSDVQSGKKGKIIEQQVIAESAWKGRRWVSSVVQIAARNYDNKSNASDVNITNTFQFNSVPSA